MSKGLVAFSEPVDSRPKSQHVHHLEGRQESPDPAETEVARQKPQIGIGDAASQKSTYQRIGVSEAWKC